MSKKFFPQNFTDFFDFFFRFFIAFLIFVASIGVITGRELECYYTTDWFTLWPEFNQCYLYDVDLSESFQSQLHSFTGSTSEKSDTTAVRFQESSQIEFVPKEILKEFPNLNGLIFNTCNLPILKNDLFPSDFVVLEYLSLVLSQIDSIEPFAFQNLKNLKWLSLWYNKIQSLPFNLFQTNQKLIYLNFSYNRINLISPNLLKNLNHLIFVEFQINQCVDQGFGCETCSSISQSDLDSGLSTCFQNCLKDPECATKSELVEGTTEIEKGRDPIQTTPQVTTNEYLPAQNNPTANNPNPTLQSLQTNLTQELTNSDLMTESSLETEKERDPIQTTPQVTTTPSPEKEEPETEPQDLKLILEGIDEKLLNMTEDLRVALATKIESENEAIKSKVEETNKLSHEIFEKLNKILAGKINCGLENANELLTAQLENEKLKAKILKAELLQKKMEKELKNMKLQSKGNLKQ
jgi:hypothetical protein